MAFTAPDVDPSPGDWKGANWETDATTIPPTYSARCLVGPGAVVLTVGSWDVWVKVTDAPESPARRVGNLQIT